MCWYVLKLKYETLLLPSLLVYITIHANVYLLPCPFKGYSCSLCHCHIGPILLEEEKKKVESPSCEFGMAAINYHMNIQWLTLVPSFE